MAAKTQISLAVIRFNDVKMYPSTSFAIRVFTANEIACGGWLAFHVCSGAYLIIKLFGNHANVTGLISVVFRFQHLAETLRCRYGKPVNRRMQTLLHSMWETHDTYSTTHDTYSTSLSFADRLSSLLIFSLVEYERKWRHWLDCSSTLLFKGQFDLLLFWLNIIKKMFNKYL